MYTHSLFSSFFHTHSHTPSSLSVARGVALRRAGARRQLKGAAFGADLPVDSQFNYCVPLNPSCLTRAHAHLCGSVRTHYSAKTPSNPPPQSSDAVMFPQITGEERAAERSLRREQSPLDLELLYCPQLFYKPTKRGGLNRTNTTSFTIDS